MKASALALFLSAIASTALAQDAGGEIVALDQGERAPFAGMLVLDEDLVRWRHEIERLTFQLDSERTLAAAVLDSRIAMERANTQAAESRLELHTELWRAEAERLAAQAARQDEWWRSPVLWFSVGVLVAVVAVVAVDVVR